MNIIPYFIFVTGVTIAACSQVLLKKSAEKVYSKPIREYLNVYVIIGYLMLLVSMLLQIIAFKNVIYKNGAIIEALGYIIVMGLSYFFFQEKISRNKIIGTVFILVGITVYYM